MTNWDNLVTGKDLISVSRLRRNKYQEKKGFTSASEDYQSEGWEAFSTYKNPKYTKYRKEKSYDEQFEDAVWYMFYKMGFSWLNKDRTFRLASDPNNPALTQQIDVFAVEDETIFVVECKSCDKPKEVTFKKELEALNGQMFALRVEILKQFQDKKVVFVWATKNAIIGDKDKERMAQWNIVHFDDATIEYYTQLSEHLGTAARYQLLGSILKGRDIKNMDMDVPAIESRMGGLTYYSFSIEPSKLLKIGYVLHRTKANSDMMPTYQRIIKKARLAEIRKFVDGGGYFPNSIIISIDTSGKKLVFDPAAPKKEGSYSRIGTLHLPKRYHSAYIIDGQHRLYGYSDSQYGDRDCVPVVAFVDLDRQDQLKLFMDINENQKAVPKKLRVTLNKDMYWDSRNLNDQRIALRSKIASSFGEDSSSPLLNRVDMDEDNSSTIRCISVEELQTALNQSHFFNTYDKKNTLKEHGTFDFGDLDKTYAVFFPFICGCLKYIMNECPEEWDKGKEGILTINRGISACIRVIDDIVNLLISQKKINPLKDSVDSMVSEVSFYLEPLTVYIKNITPDQANDIKKVFGSGAKPKFYHYFQKPIADKFSDFNPPGMTEWFESQSQKYNEQSRSALLAIEQKLRTLTKEALVNEYGASWKKDGVKKDILMRINNEAYEKSYESDLDHEVDDWDMITLKDISQIATYGSNWSKIFEKILTRPEDVGNGRKEDKLAWLDTFAKELNKMSSSSHSVDKKTYDLICSVYNWLLEE